MNRFRFLVFAPLLAALAFAGCAPQEPKLPPRTRAEVLSIMDQRAASLKTLRAKLSLDVKLGDMSSAQNFSASFAASGPSSIRLHARHPLVDYDPIDLGCDGSTWWVYLHYQDTNRVDYGRLVDLERTASDVPLRPDQVVAILGMTPLRDNPPISNWVFTVYPGHYLLQEIVRADGTRFVATRITVDGDTNLITRYETLFPSGRTDMMATLDHYRTVNGFPIASNVHVRLLGRKHENRLDFAFSDVQVNPTLPAGIFNPLDFNSIPQRFVHPLPSVPPQASLSGSSDLSLNSIVKVPR